MEEKLGRTRQLSESAESEDPKRTRPDDGTAQEVAASPPSFVDFDKLMESLRRDTETMQLAHEIALNPDFKLQKPNLPANSLYALVQQNMRKAYWDIIKEDILKEPPVLDMVIKLCQDMRQSLLDLLLPHQSQMRERISELFDIELIKQQCESQRSIDPLKDYAPALLGFMQRLCCPMRDEEIEALRGIEDTVELFQGMTRVLEEMKLDFSNFLIDQIRPVMRQTIVSYEQNQMKKIQTAQELMGVDPHKNTKRWLRRAFEDISSVDDQKPATGVVLLQGFMQAVFQHQYISEEWELPETLDVDRERILELQQAHLMITIGASAITIAQTYLPPAKVTAGIKGRMKDVALIVLADVKCSVESELREALSDVATKFFQDIQKETSASLSKQQEILFHGQIADLVNLNNAVRNLIYGRIVAFVSEIAKGVQNVKVPLGLSTFEKELLKVVADFLRVISLNRATHSELYTSIVTDIASLKPGGTNDP
ncbi:T-complex protein 11-like protein 1 [Galendromus occidentalis]|uniref:T-complex protein 11-like protein 1 n=1 Tax=Galendromus occidentalis TaxID=34638 RepID=A0AAJ6QP27_9ACAR|nr:T-complex protein 11-like protein 1 [Galendromus occidentalis]